MTAATGNRYDMPEKAGPGNTRPIIGVKSDAGRVRSNNEDSYWVPTQSPDGIDAASKGWLFIVADGMGGYQGGEVASAIVIKAASNSYYRSAAEGGSDDITEALRSAVLDSQQAVLEQQARDPEHAQMGSTLVMAVIHGADLYVANLGDSRCYRLRGGTLSQLTHDHSWVAEQVRNGLLSPEEAQHNMNRSLLTRALGQASAAVKPEIEKLGWQDGDRLLLCCDGLWDMVPDGNIRILLSKPDAQEAADALVEAANAAGGADNITAVVVGALQQSSADTVALPVESSAVTARLQAADAAPVATRRPSALPIIGLGLLILVIIAAVIFMSRAGAPAQGSTTVQPGLKPAATAVAAAISATGTQPAPAAQPSATVTPKPTSTIAVDATSTPTEASTPTLAPTQSFSETLAASTAVATEAATAPAPAPNACISRTVTVDDWQWNPAATGVKPALDGITVWGQAHIATKADLAGYLGVDKLQVPFTITIQAHAATAPAANDLWVCFQDDVSSVRCTNIEKGAQSVSRVDATANTWSFAFPFSTQPQLPQLRVISLSKPKSPVTITGIVYCP